MKCKIPNCVNEDHQGTFVGDECSPCYSMNKNSQFYRNLIEELKSRGFEKSLEETADSIIRAYKELSK